MEPDLPPPITARAAAAFTWAMTMAAASGEIPRGLNHPLWQAAAAQGLLQPIEPTASHRGARDAATIFTALGRAGLDRGFLFALGAHLFGVLAPFLRHAAPAQRARWETGLRDGRLIGALAVTEPGGGSSFDTLATSVRTNGSDLHLTGRKVLITNAPDAHLLLVLARHFPDRGPLGLSMFAVPRDTPGLAIHPIATTGLHGAPMGEVDLEACRLTPDQVIGAPGAGLRVFQTAMAWERSLILAAFLGAATADLRRAILFLTERKSLHHQTTAHRIARIHLRIAAAGHLLDAAAAALDAGREDLTAAAMAKLAASEAVVDAASETARLLAGAGWRGIPFDTAATIADTIGTLFASGTSEIQLDIIARHAITAARRQ